MAMGEKAAREGRAKAGAMDVARGAAWRAIRGMDENRENMMGEEKRVR